MTAMTALVGVLGTGCGGGSDAASTPTTARRAAGNAAKTTVTTADNLAGNATTTGGPDPTTAAAGNGPDETTAAPPTVAASDPASFEAGIALMNDTMAQAGGDVCKLISALTKTKTFGNPTTPQQVEAEDAVIERMLTMVANAAPASMAAEATTIRTAVASMMDQARAGNFSVSEFTSGGPKALTSPDFVAAIQKVLGSFATSCAGTAPGG